MWRAAKEWPTSSPDGSQKFGTSRPVPPVEPLTWFRRPGASPVISGTAGTNAWYTFAVTVAWNWAAGNSAIDPAHCTASSTSTSQGDPVTLTATCLKVLGGVGTATVELKIDTTAPRVSVTGVSKNHVYALGHVPAAGCSTTDSLSRGRPQRFGQGHDHRVKRGRLLHGNLRRRRRQGRKQSVAVSMHHTVGHGFRGFIAPKPGATLTKSASTIAVKFRPVNWPPRSRRPAMCGPDRVDPGSRRPRLHVLGTPRATTSGA
jgi:hypothetical protein